VQLLISAHSRENGTHNSARCSLDGALTLGRGPESPLLLDGTGISREHLRLLAQGDGIFITDLSSNGTWLNGRRLTRGEPHPFTPADAITIPGFEIRIDVTKTSATDNPQPSPPAPVAPQAVVESRASGPLAFVRGFGASLSRMERLLITLALTTLMLVALYLTA
jgi:predicted component of type VI protein secretion system